MDNSVNNNVSSNVNNTLGNNASNVQGGNANINTVSNIVNSGVVSNNSATNVNPSVQTVVNSGGPTQGKKKMNVYVVAIIVVVVVLLIAILLLVFLLTGGIDNRNKLTCTKVVNGDNYTETMKKVYKLEDGKFTRFDAVYTFDYTGGLTDDVYEQTFSEILNNPSGVTQYGFDTKVTRDGNVVTLTFYYPSTTEDTYQKIVTNNEKQGFTCK